MNNLIKRLRWEADHQRFQGPTAILNEAADELAALAEKLKEAEREHQTYRESARTRLSEMFAAKESAERRIEELAQLLRDIRSPHPVTWGVTQAWIVEGAPDRESGIAMAKRITNMNVRIDAALKETP